MQQQQHGQYFQRVHRKITSCMMTMAVSFEMYISREENNNSASLRRVATKS